MKRTNTPTLLAATFGTALLVSSASADVVLSSDFTGSTATPNPASVPNAAGSGTSAGVVSDITWTTSGLTDPGDVDVTIQTGNGDNELFTTARADDHIAVDNNIGNGGVWFATINTSLSGSDDVELTSVDIDFSIFNNSGVLPTAANPQKDALYSIEVINATTVSSLGTASVNTAQVNDTGSATATFASPVVLSGADDFEIRVTVSKGSASNGTNNGIDAITFNGNVVPEPGSLALLGLGGLCVLRRRR